MDLQEQFVLPETLAISLIEAAEELASQVTNQHAALLDIYKQLAYAFCGAGLIANDLKKMEEKDGAEAKEASQRLPNPKQSRKCCFLVNGGIVNLGTSSHSMIIEAVGGSEEFQQVNKHLFQPHKP
jgi:hypothetical protein